ncbi:MAG: RNA methyltransferase, partial [bacterium]
MGNVYIALLHHPVLNRAGEVVSSSVTGIDVHDMARAGRAYGAAGAFVVHPSAPQRRFARRMMDHFLRGPGREIHPMRAETLRSVEVAPDLDAAIERVEARE